MGGLQIRDEYPEPVEFAFCAVQGRRLLDANGFAIRSDASDSGAITDDRRGFCLFGAADNAA